MSEDCVFCKIVAGEIPSKSFYEDERVYAFGDINPQAPVHVLVVPKEHRGRITDYGVEDAELLGHLHVVANTVAREQRLDDFRLVINCGAAAGQTVWHLHLHLLGGRAFSWPPG